MRTIHFIIAAFAVCGTASAQFSLPSPAGPSEESYRDPAKASPIDLKGVTIAQRLDNPVDLSLKFTDSNGREVELAEFFHGKPVVLSLVYYDCPMLCTLELNGLLKAMRAMDLAAGEDYEVVTVSFDPRETPELAARKKELYVKQYLQAGIYSRDQIEAGWHFLVGEEESIAALTDQVGFRYRFDEEKGLYRHASGLITLTPEGRVSRYQFGVEYSARDLKFNLVEASSSKIGSPIDAVMLYCFHYDPITGKYGFVVMRAMRLLAAATLLLLGGFVALSLFRERRRKQDSRRSEALG